MKKKYLLIIPFLVIAAGLLLYLYSFTTTNAEQLYLTVVPEDACGWEITGLQNGVEMPITPEDAINGGGTAVLRRTIPDEWSNYDQISVSGWREMCIFVGDELVFSNIPAPITAIGELPQTELPEDALFSQVFAVNPAWSGKTITVLTRTFVGEPFASISFNLLSGTVASEQQTAWANALAIPGAIFATLFLLLLGLFLYRLPAIKKALPLLLLALAALLLMLFYLDRLTTVSNKMNTVSTSLSYDVVIQALYILMPLLYAATQMRKERKLFLWIIVPIWAVYFASVAAWSVFHLEVPTWFDALAYLTLLLLAILVGFSIKIARDGDLYFQRLLKVMGIFVLGAGTVFGLSALFVPSLFELSIIYWKEAVAGYPFPLAYIIFTAILPIEFLLALVDLVESRVRTAQEVETLKLRNELTVQSLLGAEQTNEALAVARHDELHHLRALAALYRDNPLEAADYAATLAKKLEAIPAMRFTENRLVNAILSIQSINAAKAGVRFEAKARLPESLPFPACDISTVLMNLLENAIEAAAKALNGKKRNVSVLLDMEEETFLIAITNSLPEGFDRELFRERFSHTTKADETQHGYGIRSAQNVVSHYGGKLRYSVHEDTITVNTVMERKEANRHTSLYE